MIDLPPLRIPADSPSQPDAGFLSIEGFLRGEQQAERLRLEKAGLEMQGSEACQILCRGEKPTGRPSVTEVRVGLVLQGAGGTFRIMPGAVLDEGSVIVGL